ncbi:MAG: CHASE domain-containing protein [Verrucomicrobia bacterium]|nr:CHASE domain-containing protein [Verrucomicrobiota bacterium]
MQNGSLSVREKLRRRGPAYAVLAVSLLSTGILYLQLRSHVESRDQKRFDDAAGTVFSTAQLYLDFHLEVLSGVRGMFLTSKLATQEEWKKYFLARNLGGKHPGILAVGFAQRVAEEHVEKHVASMRAANPAYRIKPEGKRSEYFPILYLEEIRQEADMPLGWDAFSDTRRRAAMERARDTGEPSSTGKIPLHRVRRPEEPGFIVYLPIYADGTTPASVEAKRASLRGFVFCSYAASDLWAGATRLGGLPIVDLEVFDGAATEENLLYDDDGVFHAKARSKYAQQMLSSEYGRSWTYHFCTVPGFAADSRGHLPMFALCAGVAVSLLLFGIAWTQASARAAADNLSWKLRRSEESLRKTNEDLESKIAARQAAEEALTQNQVRLKLLNSILACMASGSGVGETLVRVLRRIEESFPDRQVIYSIMDPAGHLTVVCSAEPTGWPSLTGHAFDMNGAPEVLAALRRREPMALNDLSSHPHAQAFARTLASQGVRAVLAFPLKQSSDEVGLLCLCAQAPHDWSEHEIVTLQEIAEHLFLAFRHDDAERKRRQAERMLAHEKELLAATLRSTADGVMTTDTEGTILLINKVAEDLTGWGREALGRRIIEVFDLIDEQTRERINNPVEIVLQTGKVLDLSTEALLLARDEQERAVATRAAPIFDADGHVSGAVLVFQDVTEKQKLEAEMLKASRIESLGLLAGGIAHDFNNIMTGILGNVSLARMFAPAEPELQKRLEQAEKACLRARDLTQQLLAFAKGGNLLKRTASLSELIDEASELALRGSNVRSAILHAPDLWPLDLDPAQIRQVINHLVLNAAESMPDGGTVNIRTENVTLSLQSPLPLPAGNFVKTVIEDRGIGIRPEHLEKIFDPYFGAATPSSGLGLATAYLIIKKHGGVIQAESELGVGTRFEIYLPVSTQAGAHPKPVLPQPPAGLGRILVMDDDASVRELAMAALSRLGYEVELARDGAETIRRYSDALKSQRPFAVVILDLTGPGAMGAREALKQLTEIDPNVKAIVSSGYALDPAMSNFREYGFSGSVSKPYRLEDLAKVLHQVVRQDAP